VAVCFDATKNARNITEGGISFGAAADFERDTALVVEDLRKEYGERRFQAPGLIAGRRHALAFTPRAGRVHGIRLRKASRREVKCYEAQV